MDDIQTKWFSVIRRLQSVGKSNGASILSINILVDKDGTPIAWTEPKKTLIEPSSKASHLINLLLGDDTENI